MKINDQIRIIFFLHFTVSKVSEARKKKEKKMVKEIMCNHKFCIHCACIMKLTTPISTHSRLQCDIKITFLFNMLFHFFAAMDPDYVLMKGNI